MILKELIHKVQDLEVVDMYFFQSILLGLSLDKEVHDKFFQSFRGLKEIRDFSCRWYPFLPLINTQCLRSLDLNTLYVRKTILPEGLPTLNNLKTLSFSCTIPCSLPDELFQLTQLEHLLFEGTSLYQGGLPEKIKLSANLKSLKLPISMPDAKEEDLDKIFSLTQLEHLNIYGFRSQLITNKLSQMQNLKGLACRATKKYLPTILQSIGELKNLEYLETNFLKTLPEHFLSLQKLRNIKISLEHLEGFNHIMGILSQLQSLRNIQIKVSPSVSDLELPESVIQLQQISSLEILGEDIDIHRTLNILSKMPNLTSFNIRFEADNQEKIFKNLPKLKRLKYLQIYIGDMILDLQDLFLFLQKFDFLEELKLNYWGTDKILLPETLPILSKLKKLEISGLSSSNKNMKLYFYNLSKFTQLKELSLMGADNVPDEVALLSDLKKLNLRYSPPLMLEYLKLKKLLPNTEIIF